MQDTTDEQIIYALEDALDCVVQNQIAFWLGQVSLWDESRANRMLNAFHVLTQCARSELNRLQAGEPEILSINNQETP